jgi:predicted O-linked N-acetylglucosamine transferase (SPINDLY family)
MTNPADIQAAFALREVGRTGEALTQCDAILARMSPYAPMPASLLVDVLNLRGSLLMMLRRLEDAAETYNRALQIYPGDIEALNNLGAAYSELGDHARALEVFKRALAVLPDSWQVHNNIGIALCALTHFEGAIESYGRAQALNPDYAEAFYNQGDAYIILRRYEDAATAYDRAVALKPDLPYALGAQFYARMQLCDWSDHDAQCAAILAAVDRGEPASAPFPLLLMPSSATQQHKAAQTNMDRRFPKIAREAHPQYRHTRLRIAYVSSSFRQHPIMQLAIGVFEHHDRTRFETFAWSLVPGDDSAMRKRLEHAFDHFIDAQDMDDHAIAEAMRAQEIDIAIDLDGFTEGSRMGVLAPRPAPVQALWLGYAGTSGAPHLDTIIADSCVIPPGAEGGYSERVARLAHAFQPNSERPMALPMSRAAAGLPDTGFVFCCFNNLCKITPDVFAIWMRLLAQVDGSVLWLRGDNDTAQANLRLAAGRHGISGERLIFAPRVAEDLHYARMMAADLFIDTFTYNAHTTASDALWAGLPLVTRIGETFASRVAASLLHAVGLPEMVTDSSQAYEALILKLARDADALGALRRRLVENRSTAPLFDIARFTRDLEQAYEALIPPLP